MSGSQPAEDRIEDLQTRVDAQETQLRLLWGLLLYGCMTLVVSAFEPGFARFLGVIGFLVVGILGLLYLPRRPTDE